MTTATKNTFTVQICSRVSPLVGEAVIRERSQQEAVDRIRGIYQTKVNPPPPRQEPLVLDDEIFSNLDAVIAEYQTGAQANVAPQTEAKAVSKDERIDDVVFKKGRITIVGAKAKEERVEEVVASVRKQALTPRKDNEIPLFVEYTALSGGGYRIKTHCAKV